MDLTQNNEQSSIVLDTTWVESLAIEELNLEQSGVVNIQSHFDPRFQLEESSIKLMDHLRDYFEVLIDCFNDHRGLGNEGKIKIFKISNTVNDFMLYRHSLKLVVARKDCDLISICLMSNTGGMFAARGPNDSNHQSSSHEIKAHIGPFSDITWRYQGEAININALVKHYLSEFVRQSAK